MTTEITDYIRVADRAAELGCPVPAGIAVLPDNFETAPSRDNLLFRAEASTIRKLLRGKGIEVGNFFGAHRARPKRP